LKIKIMSKMRQMWSDPTFIEQTGRGQNAGAGGANIRVASDDNSSGPPAQSTAEDYPSYRQSPSNSDYNPTPQKSTGPADTVQVNLPDPSAAGVGSPFEFDPAAVTSVVNTVKQSVESGIDSGLGFIKDVAHQVQDFLPDVPTGGIGGPLELDPSMFDPSSPAVNNINQQQGDLTNVPTGEMTEFPEANFTPDDAGEQGANDADQQVQEGPSSSGNDAGGSGGNLSGSDLTGGDGGGGEIDNTDEN